MDASEGNGGSAAGIDSPKLSLAWRLSGTIAPAWRLGGIPQHHMAFVVWSLAVIEIARSCLLLVPASVAYSVVADVEGYPKFLPACESVMVPSRTKTLVALSALARVVASKAGASFELVTLEYGAAKRVDRRLIGGGTIRRARGRMALQSLG